MAGFIQQIFAELSFDRDESLWMSDDDARLEDRFSLLTSYSQADFKEQFTSKSREIFKKNDKLSKALYEKGKLSNAQGALESALSLFNQSLMYAPSEEDMAQILSERSSILIEKGESELGIKDLHKALGQPYPNDQVYKLYERLGDAFEGTKTFSEAREAYANALAALDKANLKGKRNSLEHRINNKIKFLKDDHITIKEISSEQLPFRNFRIPKGAQHPGYPSLINGLRIEYSPSKGRYVVADRDISPGELIAVDEPYVWMLDREEARTFCWHCLRKNVAPMPCPNCVNVLFCSDECLASASKDYHPWECSVVDLLYSAQIGGWTLAYKALIRKPADYYLSKKDIFLGHNEKLGLNASSNLCYNSKDIFTFHNLVTHDSSRFKKAPELMMQALTAVYLLRVLELSGYFQNEVDDTSKIFFLKLIHHFMRCVYYNTHEITTNHLNEFGEYKIRRIGRATNPTLALFNHSCDPNYRRISYGRWTYGFATRPIPKGAEILDTYTQIFAAMDKNTRLGSLEKYNFTCECLPCLKDLPTLEFLPKDFSKGPVKKVANKLISALSRVYASEENMARNLEILCKTYHEMYRLLDGAPHQFLIRSEADLYNAIMVCIEKIGVEKVYSIKYETS
eukprot:TRINITY_DN3217_c0_g1_i1.p1 TRINITY_DN3217_c0_g1~~TRINITY_DN3217_c0_g1_i1.p1  ORF type:complete len:626 (-),score=140.54 TRINITY_DN3217_c0_g1_i1:828-2705(-)